MAWILVNHDPNRVENRVFNFKQTVFEVNVVDKEQNARIKQQIFCVSFEMI